MVSWKTGHIIWKVKEFGHTNRLTEVRIKGVDVDAAF